MENIQEIHDENSHHAEDRVRQQQAIVALIQGVMLGQKKGAYTLEEAAELDKAVKCFIIPNQLK